MRRKKKLAPTPTAEVKFNPSMRRELTVPAEDKLFSVNNGVEKCSPNGYEVCFNFREDQPEKNVWWSEYVASNGKLCYSNPHKDEVKK